MNFIQPTLHKLNLHNFIYYVQYTNSLFFIVYWFLSISLSFVFTQTHVFHKEGLFTVTVNASNTLGSVQKTLHVVSMNLTHTRTFTCDILKTHVSDLSESAAWRLAAYRRSVIGGWKCFRKYLAA